MGTKRQALKSAGEIIDALGGPKSVSELFNVTKQAVSLWRRDGFPPGRHYRISKECERLRLPVDDRVFQ